MEEGARSVGSHAAAGYCRYSGSVRYENFIKQEIIASRADAQLVPPTSIDEVQVGGVASRAQNLTPKDDTDCKGK